MRAVARQESLMTEGVTVAGSVALCTASLANLAATMAAVIKRSRFRVDFSWSLESGASAREK